MRVLAFLAALSLVACGQPAPTSGCQVNGDCPEGETCLNRQCVSLTFPDAGESTRCTSNQDCQDTPETSICVLPGGACSACLIPADCHDAKKTCKTNACVWVLGSCSVNSDCSSPALAATPVCDSTDNTCVECVAGTDCMSGFSCNASHHCEPIPTGCSSNIDCPGGTCVNHSCVPNSTDAGPLDAGHDAGPIDAGHDAGPADAGYDAGTPDAGHDAGPPDAGHDAGPVDAGYDAGPVDAGYDAGPVDAGYDAGTVDAGYDAGTPDAGHDAGPLGHPCTTSGDCSGSTRFCLADVQICVGCYNDDPCVGATAACSNTYQCGNSKVCSSDGDCVGMVGRPICGGYQLCTMGCFQDSDCLSPLTPRCLTGARKCVACVSNGDCGSGQTCSSTTHTCL